MDKLIFMKKPINVLITGAGAPGIAGTIYSLRNNYENREFYITTTDIKDDVIGKYISDDFYIIPPASDSKSYLKALYDLCRKKNIRIILPQNTSELLVLASNKKDFEKINVKILISDKDAIEIANNKFELMKLCRDNNIPVSSFNLVDNFEDLVVEATKLGWPNKKVVIKPPSSNGTRGVRIIDEKIDLKKMFYDEKPTSLYIKMESLRQILGEIFSELVVMEYLPGKEYTVDLLSGNDYCCVIPRTRDLVRSGITFNGSLERNEKIIEYSTKIAKKLNLKYCFGFQYKLDEYGDPKIIESNPRIQGTMIMSTLAGANLIYSAVKMLLEEDFPKFDIDWTSKFYRYWGGIGVNKNEIKYFGF